MWISSAHEWQNDCTCHAQQSIVEIPSLDQFLKFLTSSWSCWKWSSSWSSVADEQVIEQAHHAPWLIARRWSSKAPSLIATCHSRDACTSRRTRLISPIVDPLHTLLIMRRWCNRSKRVVAFSLALPLPLPLPSLPSLPPGAATDASEDVPVIWGWSEAKIRDPYLRDRDLAFDLWLICGWSVPVICGWSVNSRRCDDRAIVWPNEYIVNATNLILIIDECIDELVEWIVEWDSCALSITMIQLI